MDDVLNVSLFSISSLLLFGGKSRRAFYGKKLEKKFSHKHFRHLKNIFLKKEKSVGFKLVESNSKTADRH